MSPAKPEPPRPRDVSDGIPDRAAKRPAWKYIALAGVFVAWLAVLIALYWIGQT